MCGIAGIYNPKGVVNREVLRLMTDSIIHRGPDGEGQWLSAEETVGLGHRRLSIIDLSENGHQPMSIQNSRFTITFNGEIYNYIELKNELLAKGVSFESESDTEVLLWLYATYGEKCLNMLDGMFVFVIWDEVKKELFFARDRFGEKPLFYSVYQGCFYFGSEIKAIWAAGVPKKVNQSALTGFIETGQIQEGESTHFDGIRRFKHSHYLYLSEDLKLDLRQYWSLDNISVNQSITFEEAENTYRDLFVRSVERRLRSDVAVGSSLSGGIDSSSVVCVIDKLKDKANQQNVFSARFSNFAKDEGTFIELVKEHCQNVNGFEVFANDVDLSELLEKIVFYQEEPFGSSSISAQWLVMKLAKDNGTTVLLDGQGADEFLAGYFPCYDIYLSQLFYTDVRKYKSELKAYNVKVDSEHRIQSMYDKESIRMKIGRYKKNLLGQPIEFVTLKEYLKTMLLDGSLQQLLRYADRNSMAHSREVRLPFLNHELIEFVFSLPDDFILQNGWTKYIHRKALAPYLPSKIAWRADKVGFEPPQKEWLKNQNLQSIIDAQATVLNITRSKDSVKSYTQDLDWRLLMSSFFSE